MNFWTKVSEQTSAAEGALVRPVPTDTCDLRLSATLDGQIAQTIDKAVDFELVTTATRFGELQSDWNSLDDANAGVTTPFQAHAWLQCWMNAQAVSVEPNCPGLEWTIICGWTQDRRLVVALPLMITQISGIRLLTWLGMPLAQYGDALIHKGWDDCAVIDQALQHARQHVRFDVLSLAKVRGDAAISGAIEQTELVCVEQEEAPYLAFANIKTSSTGAQIGSSKARKNRRRQLRRLHKTFDTEFRLVAPGAEAARIAARAVDMKLNWLRERGLVSSALQCTAAKEFLQTVAGETDSGCHVFAVICDGRLAAVQIGFLRHGRLAMHMIVFDLEFEKYGIGMLQFANTIEHTASMDLERLDYLAPHARYKAEWSNAAEPISSYAMANSVRGWLYVNIYLKRVRPVLKDLLQNLPLALRRKIARRATPAIRSENIGR